MFVECPRCHALYRISQQQLDAANGWVRCGECSHVFEAQETLYEEEKQYLQPPRPPLDEPAATDRATEAATTPKWRTQPDKGLTNHRRKSGWSTFLWSMGIIALLLFLGGQYLLINRNQLAKMPALRPWLTRLCDLRACTLPPEKALDRIALLSRNIFTSPNHAHVMTMEATIENRAPFAQPYPILQISFSDLRGHVIAIGRFKPSQYLPHDINPRQLMPSNTPIAVNVSFSDPGPQAISYEFSFR